jgi:hypothetical protein
MTWIKELKIAIAEKNMNKFEKLMDNIPQFTNNEDIIQALFLLRDANKLVTTLRDETGLAMQKMKKHIDFLKSTETPIARKLDLKF